jgi:hypothetical protein
MCVRTWPTEIESLHSIPAERVSAHCCVPGVLLPGAPACHQHAPARMGAIMCLSLSFSFACALPKGERGAGRLYTLRYTVPSLTAPELICGMPQRWRAIHNICQSNKPILLPYSKWTKHVGKRRTF